MLDENSKRLSTARKRSIKSIINTDRIATAVKHLHVENIERDDFQQTDMDRSSPASSPRAGIRSCQRVISMT